jgi:hypothetical protein
LYQYIDKNIIYAILIKVKTEKPSCEERVKILLGEGKTGYFITCTLRNEGYDPEDASRILQSAGFSVNIGEEPWGTVLNVSSRPVTGLSLAIGNLFGGGVEVAWHKKK